MVIWKIDRLGRICAFGMFALIKLVHSPAVFAEGIPWVSISECTTRPQALVTLFGMTS